MGTGNPLAGIFENRYNSDKMPQHPALHWGLHFLLISKPIYRKNTISYWKFKPVYPQYIHVQLSILNYLYQRLWKSVLVYSVVKHASDPFYNYIVALARKQATSRELKSQTFVVICLWSFVFCSGQSFQTDGRALGNKSCAPLIKPLIMRKCTISGSRKLCQNIVCWLGSFVIFRGSGSILLRNPKLCRGVRTPCPPPLWIHPYLL